MGDETTRSGCLGRILKMIGIGPGSDASRESNRLPYRLRDDFLSPAELSFYRVLEQAAGGQYAINAKVRIADLLFVPKQHGDQSWRNKIDRKHADFLLCAPATMRPQLVIELDDTSHDRPDRQERDAFLDEAFAAAGLAILHIKAARSYSIVDLRQQITEVLSSNQSASVSSAPPLPTCQEPLCPKCSTPMVQRQAGKGKHAGKRFWACTNYPKCREIIGID